MKQRENTLEDSKMGQNEESDGWAPIRKSFGTSDPRRGVQYENISGSTMGSSEENIVL